MNCPLRKLFVNPVTRNEAGAPGPGAYARQREYVRAVWNEHSYGLERLIRLGLCLAQFACPVLLVRNVFGRWGQQVRRLAVEFYAVGKLLFPLAALWLGWYDRPLVVAIVAYFLFDTLVHLLHLIFLSDIHAAAVSYRRALLLIFMHYAEVVADFAVFYMAFGLLAVPLDPVKALYFSLVATTTVGFGDIVPATNAGRLAVMSQLAVCVVFVIVFINYFSQRDKA